MKQRFSSLDVKVIASELSDTLCSLRLANIYDLSSRILLFKFAKPDHREQILVDPGFRCHLTSFSRTTAAAPSQFVAKLRKYLRTRRVTAVAQVGTDRVLELQFSDGQYRLFIEFYAGGNIVLTDRELNILSVLRIVPEGVEQEELRVGLRYALENRQNVRGTPELTNERVRAALQKALDKADKDGAAQPRKKKSGDLLRKALAASMSEFPPMLIDHVIRSRDFDSSKPIADVLNHERLVNDITVALQEAQQLIERITTDKSSKGYIFAKGKPGRGSSTPVDGTSNELKEAGFKNESVMYEDFQPFTPLQLVNSEWTIIEFDGFNKAVDEFFSSVEGQKLESRLAEKEQNAKRKLDNARQDHEKRIGGLQQVQELNIRKAQAIEANLQRVQESVGAVNGLISQGMDWVEIARLIEMEQAKNNSVAQTIKLPLKLYENTISLLLAEEAFESEEENDCDVTDDSAIESEDDTGGRSKDARAEAQAGTDKRLAVDIDLALSPWSNARQYYDQKKTAAFKEQKTLQSSAKALKSTERKVNADLKKGLKQEKQVLRPVRKQLWFEKFFFFISSEGYLVLGGKDAQQNEILYKRYLRKGDVYIHADLQGAASVVVKNKPGRSDDPLPPSTLSQAGSFAVATSSAWDSKAVMSAWWVHPEQVSKSASTGDYLPMGSFDIQGEKNFLPPAQLLLGFGVLFRVSEASLERHRKYRHRDERPTIGADEGVSANPNMVVASKEITTEDNTGHDDIEVAANRTDNDLEDGCQTTSEYEEDDEAVVHYKSKNDSQNSPLSGHPANGRSSESERSEEQESQADDETNKKKLVADGHDPLEENLDVESLDQMPEDASSSANNSREVSSVRHLSARERRLLRKGEVPMAAAEDVFDRARDSSVTASTQPAPLGKAGAGSGNPHVRGKHAKHNKLKTKYANQDDEDRALALRLLGSTPSQKAADDATAIAAKEEQAAAQKERRRQQHIAAAEKGKEEEEIRKAALQEGVDTLDETEAETLEDLEAYIGTPLPGDEILDALVLCGPWDAIGTRCSWRAKIQFGSTKKGKAVREILTTWTRAITNREKKKRPGAGEGNEAMMAEEKTRRQEGQLLQGIREVEVVGVLPVSKVRVVMGAEGSSGKGKRGGGPAKRGGRGNKKQR
ncbi:MAG: hypothetical protein Q9224_000188 [Gallowayella concinna]